MENNRKSFTAEDIQKAQDKLFRKCLSCIPKNLSLAAKEEYLRAAITCAMAAIEQAELPLTFDTMTNFIFATFSCAYDLGRDCIKG